MKLEPISRTISKVSHWSLAKQRRYLILARETEHGERRRLIERALVDVTTRKLQQEVRRERA